MVGRTSSLEQLQVIYDNNNNNNNNNNMDYTYLRFGLLDSLWIVGPSILGPLLEEHDGRVQLQSI